MTTAQESPEQRRARVARSNRRFGVWCSTAGGALLAIALVLVYGIGIVATIDAAGSHSGSSAWATTTAGVLVFLAMCALILGEQLRRGRFRGNPNPPDTILPSASIVSRFGMLSTGWHLLWLLIALVVALTLLVPVIVGFVTGGWPHSLPEPEVVETPWTIYGAVAFATAAGLCGSLVKKSATAAHADRTAPERGRPAWRFWLYRWRVDVWLNGIGGFVLAAAAVVVASVQADPERDTAGALVAGGIGLISIAAGLLLGAQFWRTGESLGAGESFA